MTGGTDRRGRRRDDARKPAAAKPAAGGIDLAFWVDGLTFLVSAVCIFGVAARLRQARDRLPDLPADGADPREARRLARQCPDLRFCHFESA